MSLRTADVAHLLIALTLLVVVAHCMGHLFGKFRQPPVIGEILGGLLLGPTVLGALSPSTMAALFPSHGVTPIALGALYQLGLLLLLFLAGTEISVRASSKERRTVVLVASFGYSITPTSQDRGARR
jgi:Kef-type K+ transport system membrane component KefB